VLAVLLRDTHRLSEAQPLMERSVRICRRFEAQNGYQHPHWNNAIGHYRRMRQAAGLPDTKIGE
jgi:hypothetical protein